MPIYLSVKACMERQDKLTEGKGIQAYDILVRRLSLAKAAQPKEMWLTHYSPSLASIRRSTLKDARERSFGRYSGSKRTEAVRSACILSRQKVRSKMEEKNMQILAIESTCDETAAAVVRKWHVEVLSNVISTQIAHPYACMAAWCRRSPSKKASRSVLIRW